MKLTLSETAAALQAARTLVLTAHVNPDGDAIGSTLGLKHVLEALGKRVTVLLDDDIPAGFAVLPGYDVIRRPAEGESIDCDLFVVLDTMTDRIGGTAASVHARRLRSSMRRASSTSIIITRTRGITRKTSISTHRARRRARSSMTLRKR